MPPPDGLALAAEAPARAPADLHRAPPLHAPPPPRPEVAAGAVQQVAAAVSLVSDGSVELVLDPAELGPVRVGLSGSDGVLSVHIAAERSETLDLFRRHADLLARDLRAAGYGDVTFRFGGEGPRQDARGGTHRYEPDDRLRTGDAGAAPGADRLSPPVGTRPLRPAGLDIRL
ncbi:MAG: flagellar hook-length control protein FliK [Rhodobacteraceae bacterium]|nr:flagellar hook-length control protein FliK [Paracoccaceae bacterium]